MFLFAELVMNNLESQARRVDLERELEEDVFPKELQQASVMSCVKLCKLS